MMSTLTSTLTTPEQLARLPDANTTELAAGRLVEKKTCVGSCWVEGMILFQLAHFARQTNAGIVYPGSLGNSCFNASPATIRKPGASVVRTERRRQLGDEDVDFMPFPPDLAVEVISRFHTFYEIDDRVQEYLDAGFPLVWVADPKTRSVMVYAQGRKPVHFSADDELTAENALPGFRCRVADFFPPAA